MRRFACILPHEWVFGLFLIIQWVRLVVQTGPLDQDALLYAGAIVINALIIACCLRHPTKLLWQLRLWFHLLAINAVFFTMRSAVLKVSPALRDSFLASLDHAALGMTASAWLQGLVTPVLTELLSFCYLLFFPYLLISWLYYSRRGLSLQRKLKLGLFSIYGLGFLGYSLIPASGPYLALPAEFSKPLVGFFFTKLNNFIVTHGSNGVDVFPSLHCAVSAFLLFFDRQHARWRYRLYLGPCTGLWLATIYLRYHYLVDVAAGFTLAALALWLVQRWQRSETATLLDSAKL